ncbi:MAG TPA: hypothetical protein DDX29_12070 [Clostridiales bacterium]|nr:hypothetical protein [Clostridiales bacterium]
MRRKKFIALLLFLTFFIPSVVYADVTVYVKTALTGGAAGALDSIDGAGLVDGDLAFVFASDVFYTYRLDDDSAASESSPSIIAPDANGGDKRWILQNSYNIDYMPIGRIVQAGTNNVLTYTGDYSLGLTLSGNTSITLPESGTLATTSQLTTDNSTASHYLYKDSDGHIENAALGTGLSDSSGTLNISGLTNAQIPPPKVTVGTSRTVAENAEYVICSGGACSVTPITPAAGVQLCVRNAPGETNAITLVNITDVYYEKTDHSGYQANANYKLVSGGVATDSICIVGVDSTHYAIMNSTGTWSHTAP